MHTIHIHPEALIVVFPKMQAYLNWWNLVFMKDRSVDLGWKIYGHTPPNISTNIHIAVPYYTVDDIVGVPSANPPGKFAIRMYEKQQVHPKTKEKFIGWAVHSDYFTEISQ